MQRQQVERGDLRDERLRRRHGDLGAGMRVDDRIRLARDRRALRVADRHGLRTLLAGVLHRHQGVHGLPRLADRDDQGVGAQHRVAVTELVRELDVDRHPRPLLEGVLPRHPGIGGGAAGDDDDARDAAEQVVESVEFGNAHDTVTDATTQRVRDRLGLLGDLLGHERRPAALVGGRGVPGHFEPLDLDRVAVEVGDLDALGGDGDDLVLTDREGVAGVLHERGDIGGEEVLALAESDDERGVAARAHDEARLVAVHRQEREGPLQACGDVAERGDQVAPAGAVRAAEEHSGDLGVGFAPEGEALGEELGLQLSVVLDDAVVDDGEPVVIGQVRVGVVVGGSAVGRPAGVPDAGGAVGERVALQVVAEDAELARALAHTQIALTVDDGDAGGVVSAVFETGQARKKDGLALARAHVSDDSTHGLHRKCARLSARPAPVVGRGAVGRAGGRRARGGPARGIHSLVSPAAPATSAAHGRRSTQERMPRPGRSSRAPISSRAPDTAPAQPPSPAPARP